MKSILYISPFNIYPIQSGFDTRAYQILKHLSNSNKMFFLYTNCTKESVQEQKHFLDNIDKYGFTTSKRWMQMFHPLLLINAFTIIKEKKIDLIIAEGIWAGLHAVLLHFLTRIPFYFDEHNAEYIRWERMGKKNSSLLKIYEKYCCIHAQKIFCVSETDKYFIHKIGIDANKIVIIPNGVDIDKFHPDESKRKSIRKKLGLDSEVPLILFFGHLNYKPNFQAVKIIFNRLVPIIFSNIPNAKFLIVGANPPSQFQHESIIYTGIVENIEDFICASDVVIAPLISGGGTKLKIIEAISCGKVVITTNIGAEGLIGEETTNLLVITDDWDQFANKIITILKSPISDIVSKEFIEKFSWDKIVKKINNEIHIH